MPLSQLVRSDPALIEPSVTFVEPSTSEILEEHVAENRATPTAAPSQETVVDLNARKSSDTTT